MGQLRRLLKNDAIFADSVSDLLSMVKDWGASITGAPVVVDSSFGKSIKFASGDSIQLSTSIIPLALTNFSIVFWFKPTTTFDSGAGADQGLLACLGSSNPDTHIGLMSADGALRWRTYQPTDNLDSTTVSWSGWNFVVCTYDGTKKYLYINGVEEASVTIGGIQLLADDTFDIVNTNYGSFLGEVNGLLVLPRALSTAEQLSLHDFSAFDYKRNLVSHWRMDDAALVQDVGWKENGFDLTGSGLVAGTDLVNGIAGGRAIEFNGSNEYLKRTVADWQGGDSQGTISAWIKMDAVGAYRAILGSSYEGDVTKYLLFHINPSGEVTFDQRNNDTKSWITGNTVLVAGRWYHVAVTSDGSVWKLYVNGVEETLTVEEGVNNGDWLAETDDRANVTVGVLQRSSFASFFIGPLDEVMYFDAGLNNLQVRDLFEMQKQGKI